MKDSNTRKTECFRTTVKILIVRNAFVLLLLVSSKFLLSIENESNYVKMIDLFYESPTASRDMKKYQDPTFLAWLVNNLDYMDQASWVRASLEILECLKNSHNPGLTQKVKSDLLIAVQNGNSRRAITSSLLLKVFDDKETLESYLSRLRGETNETVVLWIMHAFGQVLNKSVNGRGYSFSHSEFMDIAGVAERFISNEDNTRQSLSLISFFRNSEGYNLVFKGYLNIVIEKYPNASMLESVCGIYPDRLEFRRRIKQMHIDGIISSDLYNKYR